MRSRLSLSQEKFMPVTNHLTKRVTSRQSWMTFFLIASSTIALVPQAAASSDAPQWMHALVGVTLPSYDDKTDAVLLYSDINVTVLSADKIRTHVREGYKILRPEGRGGGVGAGG